MLELQYAKTLGGMSWLTTRRYTYGMSEYDNPFTDQRLQDSEFANVEMTSSNFEASTLAGWLSGSGAPEISWSRSTRTSDAFSNVHASSLYIIIHNGRRRPGYPGSGSLEYWVICEWTC